MGNYGECTITVRPEDREKITSLFREPCHEQPSGKALCMYFMEVRGSGYGLAQELQHENVPFLLEGGGVEGAYSPFLIAYDGEEWREVYTVGDSCEIPAIPCPNFELPSERTLQRFATDLAHIRYVRRLLGVEKQ
jgi:hypothetical protein